MFTDLDDVDADVPEIVHVLPHARGGGHAAHADPDCPGIGDRDPTAKPRVVVPNHSLCSRCLGEAVDTTPDRPGRSDEGDARDRTVLEALDAADGPVTRRDLEFEAHVSAGRAKRALASLRECGAVEQVENPEDGRKPRYRVRDDVTGVDVRDRAQLTPLGTAALVVAIGALMLAVIAVGVIL